MNKIFTLLFAGLLAFTAKAQTPAPALTTQEFGKINNSDLELKTCDFEPDANAMILFNKGSIYYDSGFNIAADYHKRIKIFNDNGKDEANISIEYYGGNRSEYISGLQAETINMVNGKPEIVKLDKKAIFTQIIDKQRNSMVFSMPNVKPGSVIEYKYTLHINSIAGFPSWDFQQKIPVRYSELNTSIPDLLYFRVINHVNHSYILNKHTSTPRTLGSGSNPLTYSDENDKRAMNNIHSLHNEPYMSSYADNVEGLQFSLTSIKSSYGFNQSFSDTWAKVGGILADDEDFGGQLKRKLNDEETIINKAKTLKTDDGKIAYVFNEVKKLMKWNGVDRWYTNDGTYRAWEKKTGNSAEINLILYHLLKQSGIKAYPMVVSTREHGTIDYYNTSLKQFNRAVVYIPVDTVKEYILDATSRYSLYNETPENLLNSHGLYIDKENKKFDMVSIEKAALVRHVIMINAEIKSDSKISGTAQINDFGYDKITHTEKYKTDGEKKYTDYLRDNDNNLKITSLKLTNLEVDSLPLQQDINFTLDLTSSDDNYIYFNPNLFTSMRSNPFLAEERLTDIDFGYPSRNEVNGVFKIPTGYKTDVLPKSVNLVMPDKSISFKRIIGEQDGSILVHYIITHEQAQYDKKDYADFREFYKKLHEMLNEQIVLKKS